jgi:DNA-directed RNA polymerase subunit RPC12/RpoP
MLSRTIFCLLIAGSILVLGACAADQATSTPASSETASVRCDGCQTKWIETRTSYGADYVVVRDTEKVTVCSGCDATARKKLSGESENMTCSMCGHRLMISAEQ